MAVTKSKSRYRIGQRVQCTIEKLRSYGVFVRLDDVEGYIRRREIAWDRETPTHELVEKGQQVEAVIVELPEGRHLMTLSMTAALPDPWEDFLAHHRVGDVVEGVVRNITPFGVFVEVIPGVQGPIPLAELDMWPVEKPEELVWPGDHVEAVMISVHAQKKHIRLSVKARMKQLGRANAIMTTWRLGEEGKQSAEKAPSTNGEGGEESAVVEELPQVFRERVGRILVVEDHEEVRNPLVKWLEKRGYQAEGVASVAEVRKRLTQRHYGLYVIDLDIDGEDGLMLIREIREQRNSVRIAVMSTPESLERRATEMEHPSVIAVFAKPLDIDEIDLLLRRIGQGEMLPPWKADLEGGYSATRDAASLGQQLESGGFSLQNRLRAELGRLVQMAGAQAGIVFHMDPISGRVSSLAQTGSAKLNREAIYGLNESPVKDVIVEGGTVFENAIPDELVGRFEKLLDLLTFESCLGVPIDAEGEINHALFLFHSRSNAFNRFHVRDARAVATLMAALIEQDALTRRVQALSTVLLNGQLAASFAHELYNKMPGLELRLRLLADECRKTGIVFPEVARTPEFQSMKQSLYRIVDTAVDLKETVALFQQLRGAEMTGTYAVAEVVQRVIRLLNPLLRRNQIQTSIPVEGDSLAALGSSVRLQQALLNVMLNAIQQMEKLPGRRREVIVTVTLAKEKNGVIQIHVSDTGPGIHKRLWKRIFALGYTTREGGSGLGLFIARSLLESMAGRIVVERSLIPLGTTFLIEVPAAR